LREKLNNVFRAIDRVIHQTMTTFAPLFSLLLLVPALAQGGKKNSELLNSPAVMAMKGTGKYAPAVRQLPPLSQARQLLTVDI
jgi:hypothetical protein